MFGRSPVSNGSPHQENGEGAKDTVSTPISFTSTKRSSIDESTSPSKSHRRSKRSIDNAKPADRLSLFGTAFGGSLGKSRKPAPRYSTGCVFVENSALIRADRFEPNRSTDKDDDGASGKLEREKSTSTTVSALSRLYHIGDRKQSISKHSAGELSARQTALEKTVSPVDSPTKPSKEDKDRALLRKRTSGGGAGSPVPPLPPPVNGPGLVQGRSVLEQIGTPDFNGWLMKKGERYNTWKQRYCVLKGHNLYWMRSSENTVRTNLSGPLTGGS